MQLAADISARAEEIVELSPRADRRLDTEELEDEARERRRRASAAPPLGVQLQNLYLNSTWPVGGRGGDRSGTPQTP